MSWCGWERLQDLGSNGVATAVFLTFKTAPDAVFQLFLVPWTSSILTVVFFSLQAVALYASLSPSVRGPVAGHQQEVPDLQGGH